MGAKKTTKTRPCRQRALQPPREDYSPLRPDSLPPLPRIRKLPHVQRDEYSLCTSKFESDMPSHGVGLCGVISDPARASARRARMTERDGPLIRVPFPPRFPSLAAFGRQPRRLRASFSIGPASETHHMSGSAAIVRQQQ